MLFAYMYKYVYIMTMPIEARRGALKAFKCEYVGRYWDVDEIALEAYLEGMRGIF